MVSGNFKSCRAQLRSDLASLGENYPALESPAASFRAADMSLVTPGLSGVRLLRKMTCISLKIIQAAKLIFTMPTAVCPTSGMKAR